jgi:hypothetical protein
VIKDTGVGHISSSWPQNPEVVKSNALEALSEIIMANINGRDLGINQGLENLSSIAGPYYRVINLAKSLARDLADGFSDLPNPKNVDVEIPSDMTEAFKIMKILKAL